MATAHDGIPEHEPTATATPTHEGENGPIRRARKVGLFYRESNRLGARHHPTVLTLHDGRLSAATAEGTVLFDAPVDQFTARFTLWSTIVLTHGARIFRFVTGGYAGTSARPFTNAQIRELADADAQAPDDGSAAMAAAVLASSGRSGNHDTGGVGGVVGTGVRAVGVAIMFREQHSDFTHSLAWAEALEAAGVPTTYRTRKYSDSVWAAAGIVLSALVVVTGGVFLLLWLL
ncbi:MAG TPA: hypothetical protein PK890_02140 [Terrimesophilobacter sp.]|nr:hypothetical protein [Terrimesophilobacter sp.]